MITVKGRYLKDNYYYVGSMDEKNKKIRVSVDGSDELTEFDLHEGEANEPLYFFHGNEKVYVEFS